MYSHGYDVNLEKDGISAVKWKKSVTYQMHIIGWTDNRERENHKKNDV